MINVQGSNLLLDSSLTCCGSAIKAGMQTGGIVYHIKCGGSNYGENDGQDLRGTGDHFITPPPSPPQSKCLYAYVSTPSPGVVRASGAGKQIRQRTASTPPHLLSINCNWRLAHGVTLSPAALLRLGLPPADHPPSHVASRGSAVTGRTLCDAGPRAGARLDFLYSLKTYPHSFLRIPTFISINMVTSNKDM